jgi:hypothetical protein
MVEVSAVLTVGQSADWLGGWTENIFFGKTPKVIFGVDG